MENLSYFGTVNAKSKKCYNALASHSRRPRRPTKYPARDERGIL